MTALGNRLLELVALGVGLSADWLAARAHRQLASAAAGRPS
jgi:isopenicillin N synthase-like dioxygenase